ncbi:glyoxylate/hydroxypyruvate reductase A [Epibacterium ulvae]|uniref:2-hydroxyacid dehydrogenase n=1 Tax=Epibacterium ulvae TaxID=1156985 RepID=UPI001BFCBF0E|nr:glyoxylate/hydroxypyruvate reductase A [Epibacterium ulvae]MBT8155018.1 glyoxylate/hydroxypyruvate reductase A [Epibacterium ulvae]
MIKVEFAAGDARWDVYEAPLKQAFAKLNLDVDLRLGHAPQDVEYIVYAPGSYLQDFTPFTNAKAVLNLWAGVERIVGNETLTMPLCRMVDPGLSTAMVEWVSGHTLRYHLEIDRCLATQNRWDPYVPPLAKDRPVTILGLGELGQSCAKALAALGFPVTGWSRSERDVPGVTCRFGEDGMHAALSNAEIVVLLLPDTPATRDLLNAQTLLHLPKGARILNPGRGPLIDDNALLAALDNGQIGHATLDVFRVEPLPQGHPYWTHPNVTVTPHIAAETRPSTAAEVVAENIRRGEAGVEFIYQVDRDKGY